MTKTKAAFLFLFISLYACHSFTQKRTTIPLKDLVNNPSSNLTKFLNKVAWDSLFPRRYCTDTKDCPQPNHDFYSFESMEAAAKLFPDFLATDNDTLQRRELAAFLAHISQETSGGWATAPGGYFKWGLYFLEEQKPPSNYADVTKFNYPPLTGVSYHGRGPKQLSWNYNYGQFSEAWYGNKDSLLQHPERLSQEPIMSFASAIWFWMTPQKPKPSCHAIMVDEWKPTAEDIQKGRLPGFGATLNVINGGVECGSGTDQERTKQRYDYYKYFCNYLKVTPGDNISCSNQMPFGK